MLGKTTLLRSLAIAVFVLAGSIALFAQGAVSDSQVKSSADQLKPPEERPNLYRELGLTPDQISQIKGINIERKPLMDEANKRLREANRALDLAIYADSPSDAEVQERLDEFRQAQAEVVRIRFMSEYAVRKVLTPDQLVKFRELRRKFAEMRRAAEANRNKMPGVQQMRRLEREQPRPLRP